MSKARDPLVYLEDILDAIEKAEELPRIRPLVARLLDEESESAS